MKWIKNCNDVRAWGGDVYCIEKNGNETGLYLSVNGKREDSILVANVANISNLWIFFKFEFMGNMIYFGQNVNTINYQKKEIEIYPNVKATSALNYVDVNDSNVNYEFTQE